MKKRVFLLCAVLSGLAVVACGKSTSAGSGSGATAVSSAPAQTSAAASVAEAPPGPAPIPAPPDVAAPPADAQKSPTGLASKVLQAGTGKVHPNPKDKVKVNYTGWTKAGQMFDSSVARGEPVTFPLDGVIRGWTEGVALMVVGEKRRLWIPAALAYGDRARAGAPTGDLVFDVELLDIMAAPKPPPVPEDVKAPPATAKKTASGLAYRVLTPGAGPHPAATNTVIVNYSGWTTDGQMFDSSVVRGQPARFRLDQVIKGWTEGVQLMTKGEKTRFWIPGPLAYGDKPTRPGAPAGMLVFDIELVDFQ
jgi:peptidylprolyl isomerase